MFSNILASIIDNISLFMLALSIILPLFTHKYYVRRFGKLLFLLAVGVSGIVGFYAHTFNPQAANGYESWYDHQFESQVGLTYLALGISGIIAYYATKPFKAAVAIIVTVFLWGSAITQVEQLINITSFNFKDLGFTFLSNMLIPVFLWISIFLLTLRTPESISYDNL